MARIANLLAQGVGDGLRKKQYLCGVIAAKTLYEIRI